MDEMRHKDKLHTIVYNIIGCSEDLILGRRCGWENLHVHEQELVYNVEDLISV